MRRSLLLGALFVLAGAAIAGGFLVSRDARHAVAAAAQGTTLVLVEHNNAMTDVEQGDAGAGAGDLRVWGPNPLFDEANATDTGATTQGSCVAMNAAFDCLAAETIVFADGSTLEIQGVQLGNAQPSMRTIVGGSGQYLGATGTVSVAPTGDLAVWTKTIEIAGSGG